MVAEKIGKGRKGHKNNDLTLCSLRLLCVLYGKTDFLDSLIKVENIKGSSQRKN